VAAARTSGDERKEISATRDEVARMMTPEQIAEGEKRASEWLAAFEKRKK
jgi:hypothetical protein